MKTTIDRVSLVSSSALRLKSRNLPDERVSPYVEGQVLRIPRYFPESWLPKNVDHVTA